MPLEKIGDLPKQEICVDRDHNPPSHIRLEPGIYKHTCPACDREVTFTVRKSTWVVRSDRHYMTVDNNHPKRFGLPPRATETLSYDHIHLDNRLAD